MIHSKSYRFRLVPNETQKAFLRQAFGSSRFVYNHFLALKKSTYEDFKISLSSKELSRKLTELKGLEEYSWLYDTPVVCLQQSLRNLDAAYSKFFKKQTKFPRFKKRGNKQSIKFTKECFKIIDNKLKVVSLEMPLKVVWDRKIPNDAKISSIVISKNPSDQYFVSFCAEHEIQALPRLNNSIGVDLGLKTFAVFSDGKAIESPKFERQKRSKLKTLQRRHSRTLKGSKNREKARLRLAKEHQRISNQRTNFLHQQTTKIIRENQTIILESLKVKNMMQNHRLAGAIADASWSEFVRQLEYKSKWYNREVVKINQWFPSSQLCSACGAKRIERLKPSDREWSCNACGVIHDRDLNAAKNILRAGMLLTTGGSPGIVCGEHVGERDLESRKSELFSETEINES